MAAGGQRETAAGSDPRGHFLRNGWAAASYTATVVAPAGFTVDVNPSSFNIAAGGTQQYTVTITRTDAPLNVFRFGSLTWSDGSHSVKSPIAVRPVAIAAPAQLNLTGTSGATSYGTKTGAEGPP